MSEEPRRFYEAKAWLAHYDDGVPHQIDYPDASLPELFAGSADRHASRVALRFMGRSVRYSVDLVCSASVAFPFSGSIKPVSQVS